MREAHLSVWQWCVRTAGWCRQPPSRSFHWTVSLTIPAEYRWERELIGWKMKWKEKEESGSFKVVRKPPQLNQLCISLVWIIKVWWGKNTLLQVCEWKPDTGCKCYAGWFLGLTGSSCTSFSQHGESEPPCCESCHFPDCLSLPEEIKPKQICRWMSLPSERSSRPVGNNKSLCDDDTLLDTN